MVWRSSNNVRYLSEVKLRQARLVLRLVLTFGGSTILVFIRPLSHRSVSRCNTYRTWFRPFRARNGEF